MKNLSLVLNIVLIVAVAILFAMEFSDKEETHENEGQHVATESGFNVAYVQIDSLLNSYDLYNDLSKQFGDNQQRMESELQQKSQKLQREASDLQQKMQQRLITQRQADAKQKQLMQAQQNLVQLRDQLTQKLSMSQQIMNKQVFDSVRSFLNDLNKKRHYKIVFSTAQNNPIFIADPSLDITHEVIIGVNKRYSGK